MLEQILKKLNCSTIEEFFEQEKIILDKYSGMSIERENPLVKLSDEEMDYFESEILPNLDKRPDEKRG